MWGTCLGICGRRRCRGRPFKPAALMTRIDAWRARGCTIPIQRSSASVHRRYSAWAQCEWCCLGRLCLGEDLLENVGTYGTEDKGATPTLTSALRRRHVLSSEPLSSRNFCFSDNSSERRDDFNRTALIYQYVKVCSDHFIVKF